MAQLQVMHTHLIGRKFGSAHLLDEAAHIWHDGAFTGDVDAFYWANGTITLRVGAHIG
jgi:hypothetical protein